jgi:hypothetical protein
MDLLVICQEVGFRRNISLSTLQRERGTDNATFGDLLHYLVAASPTLRTLDSTKDLVFYYVNQDGRLISVRASDSVRAYASYQSFFLLPTGSGVVTSPPQQSPATLPQMSGQQPYIQDRPTSPSVGTVVGSIAGVLVFLLVIALVIGGIITSNSRSNASGTYNSPPQANYSPTPSLEATTTQSIQATATSDASPEGNARRVIQTFYNDINAKDYQAAFNLWRDDGHASYDQFVEGYSTTLHDDLTIEHTTLLSNGDVQVDVTLFAQDTGGNQNYQGYYIIGMVNGEWKIIRGHLRVA